MLALLLAIAFGLVVVVVAWRLLRALVVVTMVAVLVLVGIGVVGHLKLSHPHVPGAQVAGLRHAGSRGVRHLEHRAGLH